VDGLIVMPAGDDHSYLLLERRAGMPIVFVDRPPQSLSADVVLAANRTGARDGTAHLVAQGHRRIAFLGDLGSIHTEQERYLGYCDALRDARIDLLPELVVRDLDSMQAAEAATRALLDRDLAPTAVFSAQNLVTIGVIRALRALRRQHSVAVVGFDDFLLADLLEPAVTVVAQDPHAIGRLAAEQLFARIDGDSAPYVHTVLDTELVIRGSGEIGPP
jgi:LacI family transcriptional regulator